LSENPIITAIIPVRLSTDRLYDEPERIARIIATLPHGYVPLIVDYGTAEERAGELRDLAAATGVKLVRAETGEEPFSVGHARDIGTQHAETPLVLYHDIDFLMSPRSYERVLEETRLRGMPDNAYTFFALPGAYMTEAFTERYLALFARGEAAFADTLLHDGVMRDDRSVYQNHTYAISAIVASRYHLLAIGGHDKSFVGHGAEDFELLHRLASYGPKGPRTGSYYLNTRRNSIQRYEGFRAYFALYGIDVFQRGLQMAHLWHPQRQDATYVTPMVENQERVSGIMENYDAGTSWLLPMEDLHSSEKTLVLANDEKAPAVRALRHAFPVFGAYRIRLESEFADSDQLIRALDEDGFTRILFLDPHGNEHRHALYQGIKAAGRRFVTFGRGGLPDSWFFDSRGFLAGSGSYRPDLWDRPLEAGAGQRVMDWLAYRKDSQPSESEEAADDSLADRLGVNGRQVVLVALQGPEGFHEWVTHLAQALDPRTHLVLAKRALGATGPEILNVRLVEDDVPMAGLVDLAASVVVYDCDLGLTALSCGKPVICCGEAFYAQAGLARAVSSAQELVAAVENTVAPDEDKRLRFLRYLIEDFYSFGVDANGESDTPARILFSTIRGLTAAPIELGTLPRPVSLKAPLYFSYGGRDAIQEETSAINTLIRMGSAACDRQDEAEAFRLFEAASRRQPGNKRLSRAMAEKAKEAHAAGHYVEAGRLFERAHAWAPEDSSMARSLVEAAKAAYAAGHQGEAIHLFETAQAWFPGDKTLARSLIDMGKAAREAGNYGQAVRLLDMAHSCAPQDKFLHQLLLETGALRYGGPLADLAAPISSLNEQARQAFSKGDYQKATWLFEGLRARQPDEVEHLRCLAECYLKLGARRQALECLQEALKRLPGSRRLMRRIRDVKWLPPLLRGKPFLS
jgi:predicted glycosyltransferase involved in capsule biosynthesis/tetratricopeptide (TPR) repeat protein